MLFLLAGAWGMDALVGGGAAEAPAAEGAKLRQVQGLYLQDLSGEYGNVLSRDYIPFFPTKQQV